MGVDNEKPLPFLLWAIRCFQSFLSAHVCMERIAINTDSSQSCSSGILTYVYPKNLYIWTPVQITVIVLKMEPFYLRCISTPP